MSSFGRSDKYSFHPLSTSCIPQIVSFCIPDHYCICFILLYIVYCCMEFSYLFIIMKAMLCCAVLCLSVCCNLSFCLPHFLCLINLDTLVHFLLYSSACDLCIAFCYFLSSCIVFLYCQSPFLTKSLFFLQFCSTFPNPAV